MLHRRVVEISHSLLQLNESTPYICSSIFCAVESAVLRKSEWSLRQFSHPSCTEYAGIALVVNDAIWLACALFSLCIIGKQF